MTKVIITGSKGRMGRALIECAGRNPALAVAAQLDAGDDLRPAISSGEVVIDFSFHEATAGFAAICAEHGKPIVIGTTGHTEEEKASIKSQSSRIPIVLASNYSTGVNTLFWLARKAVEILGPDFDVEIVEMHHRMKKDAPSGTAVSLAEILTAARNQQYEESVLHGRHGLVGARTRTEIGMHALRGGDVVGDHTVIFSTNGERVELTHRASSRDTFANGALRAAQWVTNQPPGLYDMRDVLELK